MHKMMELRDKLMDELEQQADRQLTEQSLELIDKLAHAIKCIDTIAAMEESSYESRESREGYSGRRYRESRDGYSGRRGGGSSRRRRDSMGRYADGYSNEGYSNEYSGRRGYSRDEAKDKLIDEMEGMMADVSPEAKHAIQKAILALGQE